MKITLGSIGTVGSEGPIWVDTRLNTVHFGNITMTLEFWRDINERIIAAANYQHITDQLNNQPSE